MSDYDEFDDYDSVNEDKYESEEDKKNEIYIDNNKINNEDIEDNDENEDLEFISESIIFNSENISTTKYLTLYEKAGIIGQRAEELYNQYKKSKFSPLVDIDENMINEFGELDFIKIAKKELNEKKIPYYIKRLLQNKYVIIDINDLILREKY
jgi:DNA-directed RNA polymerase subunit K/omega